MKKIKLLQLIKTSENTRSYSSFLLRLLHSYAKQLKEEENASYSSFLNYLYNNFLKIIRFNVSEEDDTKIFKKLIHSTSLQIKHTPFYSIEDWYSEEWKKDWVKEWREYVALEVKHPSFEHITLAHLVARSGDIIFLKYLVLHRKIDINIKSGPYLNNASTTPFIELVCSILDLSSSIKMLEDHLITMIHLGAHIYYNEYHWSALDYAIYANSTKWVYILLKYGLTFNQDVLPFSIKNSIKNLLDEAKLVYPPTFIPETEEFKSIQNLLCRTFPQDLIKIIESYHSPAAYGFFSKSANQIQNQLFFEETEDKIPFDLK